MFYPRELFSYLTLRLMVLLMSVLALPVMGSGVVWWNCGVGAHGVQDGDYIRRLLKVFNDCEDLEDLESLRTLCYIFKGIVGLNDATLVEVMHHVMTSHVLSRYTISWVVYVVCVFVYVSVKLYVTVQFGLAMILSSGCQ